MIARQKTSRFSSLAVLLWVFLFPTLTFATNKAIFIVGHYEYNVYMGKQNPVYTTTRNFTVALDGCSWIISYTNTGATEKNTGNSMTVGSCNGTNIYIIHYPSGVAQVSDGVYPYSRESHLQYIWIAFASQCVLTGSSGTAKSPFFEDIGIFTRKDYACRYQWERNPDGTPSKLIFLNDGSYWTRDPKTGQVFHNRLPPPYSDGYTLAVGQWKTSTNVAGVQFPMDFQFTLFGLTPNASSATNLSRLGTFRCIVTNVTQGDMPSIPVKLPDRAVVYDRRFTDLGYAYITYIVTNGIWPSTNNRSIQQFLVHAPKFSTEDEALAELGIRQIGDRISPNQKHSRQIIARCILLFTMILPAIYFCVRLLRTKNTRTTNT